MNTLLFLLVGLTVGFAVAKPRGLSVTAFSVAGVVGALLGGFLLSSLGPAMRGLVGSALAATIGAILAILLLGLIQRITRTAL